MNKLWQKTWNDLTPFQREIREKSLKVLTKMKTKGYSLTKASRELGIKRKTVIKYTNAVRKIGNRWKPKRFDRIERTMHFNTKGRDIVVITKDSHHASLIGKYQNAVKQFLDTGDKTLLEPFKGKKVKDSDGKWYTLDTEPENLYDIEERKEDEEFYTIYEEN